MNTNHTTPALQDHAEPGPELYSFVRGRFVSRGTSLNAWCAERGIQRQNARKALLGTWRGTKADQLIQQILAACEA